MPIIDAPNKLPSVDRLLNDPEVASLVRDHGAPLVTRCARNVLASARVQVLSGQSFESLHLVRNLFEDVARALDLFVQGRCNAPQALVAQKVAVCVVVALEQVDIEHDRCQGESIAQTALPFSPVVIEEAAAVRATDPATEMTTG